MTEAEVADKLRVTLMSSGWREVMVPTGSQRKTLALSALAMNKAEREKQGGIYKDKTDDELRAVIQETDWWLDFWARELNVYDLNRRNEELKRQQQNGGEPAYPNPANP